MSPLKEALCKWSGLVLAAAVFALSACASTERPAGEGRVTEAQTGSNLPKKSRDRVQTYDSDAVQQPLPPITRPPSGSGGG